MATTEGEAPTAMKEVEAPTVETVTTTEEPKKATKEKKSKAPKEKKPKQSKTASHPPYFQMIKEALLALNEKSGSSPYAIGKYMEEKHKAVLPANFKKTLALQLKNSAAKGKLIKIKASYKLSESGKKDNKKAATTTKPKVAPKTTATTTTNTNTTTQKRTRSATAIKTTKPEPAKKQPAKKAKKSTPAKPKQPKSIKSPAAKKAKKATAAA